PAVSRGVYNACDHYYLYLLERLSPMQVLELLLEVGVPKNQLDDHYFLFPLFTWRALEYFGWDYAKYIGRAPVRYVTRPTNPAMMLDVDELIKKYELLERDLRAKTGDDETAAITALADEIGRCNEFGEIPEMLARAHGRPCQLALHRRGQARRRAGTAVRRQRLRARPADRRARQDRLSRQLHRDARLQAPSGDVRGVLRDPAVAALAPPGGCRAGERDLARPHPGRVRPCGRGDAFLKHPHAHPRPVAASHGESSCRLPGSDPGARRATLRGVRRTAAGRLRVRRD